MQRKMIEELHYISEHDFQEFVGILDEEMLSKQDLENNLIKSFFLNKSPKYFKIFRNKFDTPIQNLLAFQDEFCDIDIFLEKCEYLPRDIIKTFIPSQNPFLATSHSTEDGKVTYFEKWIQHGASNFITYLFTNDEYEEYIFKKMFKQSSCSNQRTPLMNLLDQGNVLARQRLEFISLVAKRFDTFDESVSFLKMN